MRAAKAGQYTAGQTRTIATALDLFARHGVAGTSLQMIADALGVTKAAVYHQFKTKDEIVLAAAERELAQLEAVIDAAESRDDLVNRVVDVAVANRRTMATILSDPVIARFFAHHEPFRLVMERLSRGLVGDDGGSDGQLRAALLTAAISGAVMHPLVVGLDDETLRSQLRRLARRFLDLDD